MALKRDGACCGPQSGHIGSAHDVIAAAYRRIDDELKWGWAWA